MPSAVTQLELRASSFNGKTSTYVINSLNHSVVPENFNYEELSKIAKSIEIFEDFSNGIQDWIARHGGISTYKFQDPSLKLNGKKLQNHCESSGPKTHDLYANIQPLYWQRKKQVNFFCNKIIDGTNWQEVIIEARDFQTHDKNNKKELEWQRIANFSLSIMDLKSKKKVDLSNGQRLQYIKSIELID